jgi:hypothetical protein
MNIQTHTAQHLSESTKDLLRTLLRQEPLAKGDGDYEIGREVLKTEIKQSLEAYTGVKL